MNIFDWYLVSIFEFVEFVMNWYKSSESEVCFERATFQAEIPPQKYEKTEITLELWKPLTDLMDGLET